MLIVQVEGRKARRVLCSLLFYSHLKNFVWQLIQWHLKAIALKNSKFALRSKKKIFTSLIQLLSEFILIKGFSLITYINT